MLDVSRRRTGWLLGGIVVVIAGAAFFAVHEDEPGSERVDDAVAAAVEAPDDDAGFAAAIGAVAADGADPVAAQDLAELLPSHLDELQTIDRPVVVDALTSIMATDARATVLAAMSDWVVDIVDPLIRETVTFDEVADAMRDQVAPVFVAAIEDLDRYGDPMRDVTQPARQQLALRIAEHDGTPTPQPGDYADLLSLLVPEGGDPIEILERAIFDQGAAEHPVLVWGPGAVE